MLIWNARAYFEACEQTDKLECERYIQSFTLYYVGLHSAVGKTRLEYLWLWQLPKGEFSGKVQDFQTLI